MIQLVKFTMPSHRSTFWHQISRHSFTHGANFNPETKAWAVKLRSITRLKSDTITHGMGLKKFANASWAAQGPKNKTQIEDCDV
jgi:hypothetical protein